VLDRLSPLVERERPTHVIGHSMGAIVALALASRFPDTFRSVGVIGLPVFHGPADGYDFLRHRGPTTAVMLRDHRLGHAACQAMRSVRGLWAPVGALLTPRPRGALATMFDHSFESHTGGLDHIVFGGLVDGLADALATPVAALHGGRDRSAPLERAREVAGRQGWSFKVAPAASHQVIFERPALTARWVREQVLGAGADRVAGEAAG
jgi:pimeloyl-ACP methyl ester carboxylesterase